jgi:hypothetical protein
VVGQLQLSNKGFVCSGQVRFNSTTISNGRGATGLQGLTLDICSKDFDVSNYKLITKAFGVDWQAPIEVPIGYYACGFAIKACGEGPVVSALR